MLKLIFVGKSKETWLNEQIKEYSKRIQAFTRFEIIEIKDEKILGKNYEKIKNEEGKRILQQAKDDFVVALDVNGKTMSSEMFAKTIKKINTDCTSICFVIGGALGLSEEVLNRANLKISISKMTFTNQMVRLIVIEQIYRALMINHGRQYHK